MWLVLLLAGGCTQTEVEEGPVPPHALKEVEAGFNLKVLANQPPVTRSMRFTADGTADCDTLAADGGGQVDTRATSPLDEAVESQIASLWIGQYDAATGIRLFSEYISVMTGTEVKVKLKQNEGETTSRVWFVANQGDLGEIGTEGALKAHTMAYRSGESGLPASGLCGMAGMWNGKVEAAGMSNVSVELTRLLAKITFTYAIGGSGFTFNPTAVTLCSVPQQSQVSAPTMQLPDVTYTTYTGTAGSSGATMYWYLPENRAGTAGGEYAVDSEKKKTGKGIADATYIELTGTAEQGGVTYQRVTFRFYPGSNKNNYDIVRNSHYTMDVTLIGIDITDERITVGEIPPVVVDPTKMPAVKGGTKEVQITARPGQEWMFDMPQWLSGRIGETYAPAGSTITHQGPANVIFRAEAANPAAQDRNATFPFELNNETQYITITQAGSTLEKGIDISLPAASGAEGASSFTATKGLNWVAVMLNGEDWLNWATGNPATSGEEATGNPQTLSIRAVVSNPLATVRTGIITIKAGVSIGDDNYTDLKQEITVTQAASTATGSAVTVGAEAAAGQMSTFTATSGLAWVASVINSSWITLTGTTSGNPTTGNSQNVTFSVPVNPTASQRTDAITVRVGDTSQGPTATIAVTQNASALRASASVPTLPSTADAGGTLTLNGTSGLNLSVTVPDWLSLPSDVPSITNGNDQSFSYKASLNLNAEERLEAIVVEGGEIKKEVEITQNGSVFSVSPDEVNLEIAASMGTVNVIATEGLPWTVAGVGDAAISCDIQSGIGNGTLTFSAPENTSVARSSIFTLSVTGTDPVRTLAVTVKQKTVIYGNIAGGLQVAPKTATPDKLNWDAAMKACADLTADGVSGWRLPTIDEFGAIFEDRASLGSDYTLKADYYWSGTEYSSNSGWQMNFSSGATSYNGKPAKNNVRCVRDL